MGLPTDRTDPFQGIQMQGGWFKSNQVTGLEFSPLVDAIEQLSVAAKQKIATIRSKKSSIAIADMFDLQSAMQRLSQMTEMSSSVVSSMNQSMSTMSRNMK